MSGVNSPRMWQRRPIHAIGVWIFTAAGIYGSALLTPASAQAQAPMPTQVAAGPNLQQLQND